MKPSSRMQPLLAAVRLLGLGWYVVTSLLLGVFVGLWLDDQTGLAPLFLLVGLGLGLAAAAWGTYKMVVPLLSGPQKDKR